MPHERTRSHRAGISRAVVMDAALTLVDREGLGALSMRRLGAEVGVEAMTLYHYVQNKDAVLDGLVERVFEESAAFGPNAANWQVALRQYAHSLRMTLLKHPAVLSLAVSRPAVTPATLRSVEHGLSILRQAGFPLGRALDVLNAITVFVLGHIAAEIGTASITERSGPGSPAHLATLSPVEFPLLVEAAASGEGTDDASRFAFAIDALLTGFSTSLDRCRFGN